ncbi:hypothetical protein B0T18DRAFT_314213, partial [Schizothecium vesticola]
FTFVRNVKAKYGIVNDDIYNFNKTKFIINIIFYRRYGRSLKSIVVTTSDGCSKVKLAQLNNRELATVI